MYLLKQVTARLPTMHWVTCLCPGAPTSYPSSQPFKW